MATTVPFVFICYAREDGREAKRLRDDLTAAGINAWLDQSELRGGDAWERMIEEKISSCQLFIPVISKNTKARDEGYFRYEWHLAIQRSLRMAHDRQFLTPVTIDETSAHISARVPSELLTPQWTRLTGGIATTEFIELIEERLFPNRPRRPTSVEIKPSSGLSSGLICISSRTFVGRGELTPIFGLVIAGTHASRVLLRVVGPSLARFGISNCLQDPVLRLMSPDGKMVGENEKWSSTDSAVRAEIARGADKVGAFPLMPDSQDAALLLTLQPGAFTAIISSRSGATGQILFEVYRLPEPI